MYAPELISTPQTRDIIQEFKGYNHNLRIDDNEFYSMNNITSDKYPVLSPRDKRGIVKSIPDCKGILSKGGHLAYVSKSKLYFGDKVVMELDSTIDGERQLISMGAYIVIFPDMMYFNTADTSDKGHIYDAPQIFDDTYELTLLKANGEQIFPSNILYESGLDKNPFWWHGKPTDEEYDSSTPGSIYIDPFYNRGKSDPNIYLYGIPFAAEQEFKPDNEYRVEYDVQFEHIAFGIIDGNYGFDVSSSNNALCLRVRPDFYEILEKTLQDTFGTDSYVGEPLTLVFGSITVTRFLYDEDGLANELTQKYFLKTKLTVKRLNDNYSVKTQGAYQPITVGDVRLIHKDGISCLEECIKILESDINPDDIYVKTWNEPSCWSEMESFVRLKSNSNLRIGEKLQAIINNGTSEVLSVTSVFNTADTKSLVNKYNRDKVNYLKNFAKYDSSFSILVKGCLDFGVDPNTVSLTIKYENIYKNLDYVIECKNRLWGCRYGKNNKGEFVNEIYATEAGSFKNWDNFDGTEAESYVVSLGSDGRFTGAVNYNGTPIFFKETCAHIVYGAYPSNYTLVTETGMRLEEGSHKSLSIASNILYYKAQDGVYAYNGASYDKISEALGKEYYNDAVGCATSDKYYISMAGNNGVRSLFTFSTKLGVWHIEDGEGITDITRHKNNVYLYNNSDGVLYSVVPTPDTIEESESVKWYCESGIMGFSTPDAKYISKLQLRLMLPVGSYVSFYVEYDSDGYWEFIGSIEGMSLRAFPIPIIPRKCDHFRIRIEGEGQCKIYSISKVMSEGGET